MGLPETRYPIPVGYEFEVIIFIPSRIWDGFGKTRTLWVWVSGRDGGSWVIGFSSFLGMSNNTYDKSWLSIMVCVLQKIPAAVLLFAILILRE
ncbi:hypothetical protein L195_g055506 [Trifolium pratense]|uniref:Uncharacterized protein n=1 Tax=Trifolium pratense TaxID=57577 RepID=A0A2K3KLR9_TRIPR|nr:hypothetical protein L195_g055506 [Trifolium pratense]